VNKNRCPDYPENPKNLKNAVQTLPNFAPLFSETPDLVDSRLSMKKERILLFILAAVQFTNIVDFMIIMPLGPQLRKAFDINPQQFSLLVSAYTLSAFVTGLIAALIIDRFDRKTALFYSYIGFILGTVACAMSPSFELLLLARTLTGAFGGLMGTLVLAIIGDAFPLQRRGAAMGTVMASFSVGSVVGVPFGLYLASQWGWHAPFYFLAGFSALICPLIMAYVPSLRAHIGAKHENPFEAWASVAKDNNQLRALLLMALIMLGQFMVVPFIAQYMEFNVGFKPHEIIYIYLTGGVAAFFTSRLVGKWADKYGRLRLFTIFVLISIIPLVLITNMPRIVIWPVLIVTTIFFITSGGRMIPATTMVTATVSPQRRGSFMSVNSAIQNLFESIGAFIGGMILGENAAKELTHYWMVGLVAVVTSLLCIWVASTIKVSGNQQMSLSDEERAAKEAARAAEMAERA
jgi:predicted MFS family arabinose efflux permease